MKGAVIVAAGKSNRFGQNKLNMPLFDKTVLQQTVSLFDGIADLIVVVGDFELPGVTVVGGGKTRSESVRNGLNALPSDCDIVAVHDGARPFASRELVSRLFDACSRFGSAVPRVPLSDTIWSGGEAPVPANRESFFAVQTPQIFDCVRLKWAFDNIEGSFPDESTLFFKAFGDVHFEEGEFSNKKLTYPSDLPVFRVGNGFDVHPFGEGSGVILGGVKIPFDKKLVGHSDADVLTHAICDAVLTASGNRDIGLQFPDSDDRFLGADSLVLLAACVKMAREKGFCVENVSAVVICQLPKLAPHLDAISQKLASVLKISASCVNLSATTTEHLGALGNGDGIAAQAQALLSRKI